MIESLHEALRKLQLDGSSSNLGLCLIVLLILVVIGSLCQQILFDQLKGLRVSLSYYAIIYSKSWQWIPSPSMIGVKNIFPDFSRVDPMKIRL
jgi:hypothetical protein